MLGFALLSFGFLCLFRFVFVACLLCDVVVVVLLCYVVLFAVRLLCFGV